METSAPKAVFLSYASEDAPAARRIAETLRTSGVEVWSRQNERRGGETRDDQRRRQIRECALFMPVISAHTQAQLEGDFRREWRLAEERTLELTTSPSFVAPVCIDGTSERVAHVPAAFTRVPWTRLPAGDTPLAFGAKMKRRVAEIPRDDEAAWSAHAMPRIPDYELLRLIGRGSYGEVWLARGVTGILRAIKVVRRDRFPDPEPFEREFHGLKAFAAISLGEGIQLAILHVGRNDEAGFFYYVMELADDADRGREIEPACYVPLTLAEMRARRGRLLAAECMTLGINLARELAELHARGLVHRDIKPSNVILVGGVAKLADIGLVSRTGEARTFVGTEGYVPPEGPGTPAADVFALGKVLYELSTGLDRQQFPQLPPDLARWPDHRALLTLNEAVLQACDPRPERRYSDGRKLHSDLLTLQARGHGRHFGRGLRSTQAAAAVVVGLTVAWWSKQPPPTRITAPAPPVDAAIPWPQPALPGLDKSLVVLPLENLSPDPANAFFADGIHAEIVATLRRVPELKVTGRKTVPDLGKSEPVYAALGRQLGVGNAVSGSVRREGNRVRIVVELQRCADGVALWSQTYDREFRDILALQTEIADEVSRVLQAQAASGPAKARFMTKDPRAYELYLEGIRPIDEEFGKDRESALRVGIRKLEESLRLDPNFMPAANALSFTHGILFSNYERDPARRWEHAVAAKRWAETASQLVPGGAGDRALTYYHTNVDVDNGRALALAEKAVRAWPNDASACNLMAMALVGVGRPAEGHPWSRRAIALDPCYLPYRLNHFMRLAGLRRRDEWTSALEEYRGVAQGAQLTFWAIPLSRYRLFGEAPTREEMDGLPLTLRARFFWWSRPFSEAESVFRAQLAEAKLRDFDRFELQLRQCDVLSRLDRKQEAEQAARDLMALAEKMEALVEIDPSEKDGRLAQALLRAGRHDEAIAAGRRWVEAARVPERQLVRWVRETKLAEIYAEAERPRECIDLLARLLRVPSWLTVPMLRVDPVWDNVRSDPQFQALLNDPKNDAPF